MVKYVRLLSVTVGVFAFCFIVLRFWLNSQWAAAAIAAGISATGAFLGTVTGLMKTGLEIKKLRYENRKLKREEAAATSLIRSPTLEEIDKYGLKPRSFVVDADEERL